jgi:hypothetical protein
MERGFIKDTGGLGTVQRPTWIAGEPVWSPLTGIIIDVQETREVAACRCVVCGYLELYAI